MTGENGLNGVKKQIEFSDELNGTNGKQSSARAELTRRVQLNCASTFMRLLLKRSRIGDTFHRAGSGPKRLDSDDRKGSNRSRKSGGLVS